MNRMIKCLGYVAFSSLFIENSRSSFLSSRYLRAFLSTYNVTLSKSPLTTPKYFRFFKDSFPEQDYDAFLALDFEASIARIITTITDQEIIEFPCVWIDAKSMKPIKTFHRYVRPVVHETLDPVCTDLTGITDDMLRKEDPFPVVFEDFKNWYNEMKNKTKSESIVFVTCGDWDLKVMLPKQCKLSKMKMPNYMREWINIKSAYAEVTGRYPRNLKEMVLMLHLRRVGRLHRGIDDTLNVVNIIIELANRGHVFHQ